jgi:carbamoyl-phosphate synthase large subunit
MNILLTCAGRRNYLVQQFKEALGSRGQVIVCDSSASAAALMEADQKVVVPAVDRPEYFGALLALCRERRVRLLFPLNDLELGPLAQQASRLRDLGTIPVVASPQVIATCQDKWATFRWLRSCDLPTPETYLSPEGACRAVAQRVIRFPLQIKPRWGSASIGVEHVEDERSLALAYEWGQIRVRRSMLSRFSSSDDESCLVIQEKLQGEEYGIDVVNDLAGRYVCTFARRKLLMRAGETDRAITVADARLEHLGKGIGQRLGHIGNLDCDVMVTDRGCLVLDLNPRFGGGYPFSHLAGANLPAALIAWANGEEPDPSWFKPRPGWLAAKCDRVVVIDGAPGTGWPALGSHELSGNDFVDEAAAERCLTPRKPRAPTRAPQAASMLGRIL